MTFSAPSWLAALAIVPAALAAYGFARRRARRYAVRFTAVPTLRQAAGITPSSWRRHLPASLALAAIAALVLALARPEQRYRVPIQEASMMLVTDHSGSMAATDVAPTRLTAAVRAANAFIDQLPSKVRVGAVAFSTYTDAVQGPVTDHAAARAVINAQSANGATATGDALELALQLLRGAFKHPPSAIVLLSDGAANAGANPVTVARQAAQERIPIYTVALGTPNGVLMNPDPQGLPEPVPPDPQLMDQIARTSGGRAFDAQSADQLGSIYKHLGSELGTVTREREVTAGFAIAGLVLLLLAAAAATRWSGRLP